MPNNESGFQAVDRPDSYSLMHSSQHVNNIKQIDNRHSDSTTKQIVTKYSSSTTNQGYQASKHLYQNVPVEKENTKFNQINKENYDDNNQVKLHVKRDQINVDGASRPSSSKRPAVVS